MNTSSRWWDFARRWLVFAGFVVLWQVIASSVADPYFPPPLEIASAAADEWFSGDAGSLFVTDSVTGNILPSLGLLLAGWASAVVIAVPVGLALGRSPVVTDYVSTMFFFARSVPVTLLVPVFLVVLGIGPQMEFATILWGAIWPILLNTMDGARSVDDVKTETARAFRTGRRDWTLGVILPAALPKIFAGMRLALSLSIILMVVSELVSGNTQGIGFQLVNAQTTFKLPQMWAWILLVSVLGYALNVALSAVERRALRWHQGFAVSGAE